MKIYIVSEVYPYEGGHIKAAFTDLAQLAVWAHGYDDCTDNTFVYELDVNEVNQEPVGRRIAHYFPKLKGAQP